MDHRKKRKVEGKCEVIGCRVEEEQMQGMDALQCKCQCGKTWFKSLCGTHELSSMKNIRNLLHKQVKQGGGTVAPTTRIVKNKECYECKRIGTTYNIEQDEVKVKSHDIIKYKCSEGHQWYTDQWGTTRRGRLDKLINHLNKSMPSSEALPKALICKKCKYQLPHGSLETNDGVEVLVKICSTCLDSDVRSVYYSCPSCNSCCREAKNLRKVLEHIRKKHEASCNELSSHTPMASLPIDEPMQDESAAHYDFNPDDGYTMDSNENNDGEQPPSENLSKSSDLGESDAIAVEKRQQQNLEAFLQKKEVADFLLNSSNFGRECSQSFFNENHNGNDGLSFLVNRATDLTMSTDEDRDYHLLVTQFVNKLSRQEKADLVNIFNQSIKRLKENDGAETPLTSVDEIERKYLTGPFSIMQNMPIPVVQKKDEGTGFVMISSKEIVNHLLAKGFPLKEYEWSNDSHWRNEKGEYHCDVLREIREKITEMCTEQVPDDLIVHLVYVWSDSFQKNSLIQTKATDLQIFTAYFVPPDNIRNITKYTQPLAIGIKRKDHQETLVSVLKKMLEIGKIEKRYCARRCKMIHVITVRTLIQNDNPERHNNTQTLSIGAFHKRWKFSCELTDTIPSCRNCYLSRLAMVVCHGLEYDSVELGYCSECGDWWLNAENEQAWFDKPKEFPMKKCTDSPPAPNDRDIVAKEQKLKPVELSFELLTTAYNFSLHNLMTKAWNEGQFKAYLRTCCFSVGLIKSMIEAAKTVMKKYGPKATLDMIKMPEVWDGHEDLELGLDEFADTPMHMLFLGIMKHLLSHLKRLFKSASQTKKYKEFLDVINVALESCKKASFSWCRTLSLSSANEFGTQGWQSDHFAGLSRLSLVYFAYLEDVTKEQAVQDADFKKSLESFKQMLVLWNCLLSELFTDCHCDPERVDHFARLFLSACCAYGKQTEKGGKKAIYFDGTTNYFSLLNLKNLVKKYGDARKLWEGEREKYIKFVKKVLSTMPQNDTFLTTAMQQLLQTHCLDQFMEASRDTAKERLSNFKVYKSAKYLQEEILQKCQPLSGVTLKGCTDIFVCVKAAEGINLYKAHFSDADGYSKYNLWYAPLHIDAEGEQPIFFPTKDNLNAQISDTVIIHRVVNCEPYNGRDGHTVISRNWKVRDGIGGLRKLSPRKATFNEVV